MNEEINKYINYLSTIVNVPTAEVIRELNRIMEIGNIPEIKEETPVKEITETNTEAKQEETPVETVIENNLTKEEATKLYIEKYNKKPFAGRPLEVLVSKL